MLDVTLNRDEVEGDGFVKIGSVASAIARANPTSNLAQAERKLFRRVNSGVQLGLLNPLDPETLEPLSREDYGMGVVPFHELVEWGHATKLFKFKSEFISPEAVPWARAAPSMRDMVAAAQAKAAPVVRQEPEAAPVVTPEPPAAPALTESASDGTPKPAPESRVQDWTTGVMPLYPRLCPRTDWKGNRLAETDLLTLEDAARLASKHAGTEITPGDFLRAAGRGEIPLRAIVHRRAKVEKHDGGIYCNAGQPDENVVPEGSIPTLPVTACKHLADTGYASWRTFDGLKEIDGLWHRFAMGRLTNDEPDFQTTPADCRVNGRDVHALADEYIEAPAQYTATPAPVATAKRSEKKPSIETVALDYMCAEFKQGQFQSAAKFHKHLIKTAGLDKSPFEMGTGTNARKLFCPAASSFFEEGTLGKIWAKIRAV